MTKTIALYGGAFDPITFAHESICQKVHEEFDCEVWVLPCWSHKFGKKTTSAHHRWSMLQLLSRRMPFVKPCSFELDNQHSGSLYETLASLKSKHLECLFHVVIGMDNANLINKWDRGNLLVKENPFIVLTRQGEDPKTTWFYEYPHKMISVDSPLSSTLVRTALSQKDFEATKKMVSSDILDYIDQYSLY